MLYMVCPTCGDYLRNKQLVFEREMKKICDDLKIDYNMITQEGYDDDDEFKEKRQEVVNKLCKNYCCKTAMLTYTSPGRLIKG